MVRTQLYFTMSITLGIQLHVLTLYIGHRQVVLKPMKELYKIREGCPEGTRSRLTIVGGMALNLWRGININIGLLSVIFHIFFN